MSAVSSHQIKYNLKSDSNVLETLTSTEVHSLRVSLRTQAGASVISRQYLRLDSKSRINKLDGVNGKEILCFFLSFSYIGESQSGKKFSASSLAKTIESIAMDNNNKLVEDNLQIVEEPAIDDTKFKSVSNFLTCRINE